VAFIRNKRRSKLSEDNCDNAAVAKMCGVPLMPPDQCEAVAERFLEEKHNVMQHTVGGRGVQSNSERKEKGSEIEKESEYDIRNKNVWEVDDGEMLQEEKEKEERAILNEKEFLPTRQDKNRVRQNAFEGKHKFSPQVHIKTRKREVEEQAEEEELNLKEKDESFVESRKRNERIGITHPPLRTPLPRRNKGSMCVQICVVVCMFVCVQTICTCVTVVLCRAP
jgi:hypothetical protein